MNRSRWHRLAQKLRRGLQRRPPCASTWSCGALAAAIVELSSSANAAESSPALGTARTGP